jgi:hypothetical protein
VAAVVDVAGLVLADPWRRSVLDAVDRQRLPDWAVGAGFIRSAVWDARHGYVARTPLVDVDVLCFDRTDLSRAREAEIEELKIEELLTQAEASVPWQVRNQARMHLRNGDRPYLDTADALRYWLETPTAVAIRVDDGGSVSLLAPFGTDDLIGMVCRPTPRGREKLLEYRQRMAEKNWRSHWPLVRVLDS